ncbi:MAG: DNA alkylation repair protein [Verrucomicrobiota bacterium]
MKDGLNGAAVERIAGSLARTIPGFSRKEFAADAVAGLEKLELKERVCHVIGVLHGYLPDDFNETADILIQLKGNWIPGNPNDNLAGFAAWPIIDYVGEHGLGHPEKALGVLKGLTPLFSAEFAIRPFISGHFDLTFQRLSAWCTDPDEHVRRLVSEGTRPRLPWGTHLPQFIDDPSPVFRLLEKLKDDKSEYVRRSVANNLNDISKDHPDAVIACCRRWQKTPSPGRTWIVRHATRSLVKAGHPDVFGLLGYTENPRIELLSLNVSPKQIRLDESLEFTAMLKSKAAVPQKVVVDYAVHHMKASGQTSPKVFKLRSLEIAPGETVELTKRHAIKPVTTRKYHPGRHAIEILVSGKAFGQADFNLYLK